LDSGKKKAAKPAKENPNDIHTNVEKVKRAGLTMRKRGADSPVGRGVLAPGPTNHSRSEDGGARLHVLLKFREKEERLGSGPQES